MPSCSIVYQLPDSLCQYPGLISAEFETIPSTLGIALLLVYDRHPLEILWVQFQTATKKVCNTIKQVNNICQKTCIP